MKLFKYYNYKNYNLNLLLLLTFLSLSFSIIIPTANAEKKVVALFYIGAAEDMSKINNGHVSACKAMQNQIIQDAKNSGGKFNPDDYEFKLVNINEFSNKTPKELIEDEKEYINLIKTDPEKYTKKYNKSKKILAKRDPRLLDTSIDLEKLTNFLHENKVNVAIGAHWLVPLAISQAKYANQEKKTGKLNNLKVGWAFTDYYENLMFPKISNCIDKTFLGAKDLVTRFTSRGIDNSTNRVVSSGIPVVPYTSELMSEKAREDFLKARNLDPDKNNTINITLAGGGEGLGKYLLMVKSIYSKYLAEKNNGLTKKIQLSAIAARSDDNFNALTEWKRTVLDPKNDPNFILNIEKTVPTEVMLDYVKTSDVYIVKSGGLSPTEGVVIGKPMILLDVLGGHEKDNAKFYGNTGIGIIRKDTEDIGQDVFDLLANKNNIRDNMLEAQKKFREGRNFNEVSKFVLEESDRENNIDLQSCFDLDQNQNQKQKQKQEKLLSEIGFGSRDEMKFIRAGQELLSEATTPTSFSPYTITSPLSSNEKAKLIVKAKKQFKKVLVINPYNYAANYMMAHVSNLQGNSKKAHKYIEKAIKFDLKKGGEGQYFHSGNYKIVDGLKDLATAIKKDSKGEYKKHIEDILSTNLKVLFKNQSRKLGNPSTAKVKAVGSGIVIDNDDDKNDNDDNESIKNGNDNNDDEENENDNDGNLDEDSCDNISPFEKLDNYIPKAKKILKYSKGRIQALIDAVEDVKKALTSTNEIKCTNVVTKKGVIIQNGQMWGRQGDPEVVKTFDQSNVDEYIMISRYHFIIKTTEGKSGNIVYKLHDFSTNHTEVERSTKNSSNNKHETVTIKESSMNIIHGTSFTLATQKYICKKL
ncbi:MAG: hypothetical protein HQK49_20970 [Oligoflexia bacterium]|nr:hypothetical protein [Oligoflexia bacterium]